MNDLELEKLENDLAQAVEMGIEAIQQLKAIFELVIQAIKKFVDRFFRQLCEFQFLAWGFPYKLSHWLSWKSPPRLAYWIGTKYITST